MPSPKTNKPEPSSARVSLKRVDMFRVGKIIEEQSEPVVGGRAYKLGQSDDTISAHVLEQLKLPIDSQAISRVRKSLLGPFVTDKGKISDKLSALQLEVSALRTQVIGQGRLLAAMRLEIESFKVLPRVSSASATRRDQPADRINGSHP